MEAPIKLIKEGDTIKGIFAQDMDFVEGSNSKGYPTALFSSTWYAVTPKGLDQVTSDLQELFVQWYNSRPETIQAFLDGEIDKLFLDTWDKDSALKYLTEKLENYPYKEKYYD